MAMNEPFLGFYERRPGVVTWENWISFKAGDRLVGDKSPCQQQSAPAAAG
jgi:hypothetical protein